MQRALLGVVGRPPTCMALFGDNSLSFSRKSVAHRDDAPLAQLPD